MTWNEVVTKVRNTIERGLGLEGAEPVRMAAEKTAPARPSDRPVTTPAVDVFENEREFLICADVPGGTAKGATVTWDERSGVTLMVKNEARSTRDAWSSDTEPHDWYRRLELPAHVDGSKGTSTLKHGVLTVRIPKRAATARVIAVRSN